MRPTLAAVAALALMALSSCGTMQPAMARDAGQWSDANARIGEWYRSLTQPDRPEVSCCGEADAYWADEFERDGDDIVAIITDDREDAPLKRPHIEPGTKIKVPAHKLKWDQGNPTGHGVIFINAGLGVIYCYVTPSGM